MHQASPKKRTLITTSDKHHCAFDGRDNACRSFSQLVSRGFVQLVPHGVALAIVIATACIGVQQFLHHREQLVALVSDTMMRMMAVYTAIRNGTYRVECSIGGNPIQMAECQMVQGINLILVQVVTQLAEFVYSIAQMKNVFGCAALALGVVYPMRALSPRRLLMRPAQQAYRSICAYYGVWFRLAHTFCEQMVLLLTIMRHPPTNGNHHVPGAAKSHIRIVADRTMKGGQDDGEDDDRLRSVAPRSCPGKVPGGMRTRSATRMT